MNYTYEELQEMLRVKQEELDAALQREQAHVERLRIVWDDLTSHATYETLFETMERIFDDCPNASLARRDLIKQAEALEEMSSDVKSMHPKSSPVGIGVHIGIEAKKLRQQAEELTP